MGEVQLDFNERQREPTAFFDIAITLLLLARDVDCRSFGA